jgi:enolase-phosphatase E1
MLFRHSTAGDLTPWLDAFFDTNTGAKIDADSYRRIAARLGVAEGDIVFVSDAPKELAAARHAGLSVRLAIRPGNAPVSPEQDYVGVRSFDEI